MDNLIRIDQAPVLELGPETLSQMSHNELLEVIHSLEFREASPQQLEYDHRKFLQRHELERIINLLQWLRRRQTVPSPFGATRTTDQQSAFSRLTR